ncbi:hypothetical protein VTK73DRAFT_3077 [Phialemonium thermophilum]|uniref:Nudix hydrolase domain-containing protein n=1 Tax=Phialemonium thermophilum TaxID=223376 RepID=A0ABR3X0M5_9PEZI
MIALNSVTSRVRPHCPLSTDNYKLLVGLLPGCPNAAARRVGDVAFYSESRRVFVGNQGAVAAQSRVNSTEKTASCAVATSPSFAMSTRQPPSSAATTAEPSRRPKERAPPSLPRPSSSIILLSPTNEVLLLHRVHTSTSFASAHVFPGGNLSTFHDGPVPELDSPEFHRDGPAYRLAAIRETFEESGILLARKKQQASTGSSTDPSALLEVSAAARDAGRKAVHGNEVRFGDWLASVGGVPDVDGLIPFTRWITPTNMPKRFTTQMYLYMLPLSPPSQSTSADVVIGAPRHEAVIPPPTSDGGLEHTAATFDDVSVWMRRAQAGEIILFPPQLYLLTLLSEAFRLSSPAAGAPTSGKQGDRRQQQYARFQSQRDALLAGLEGRSQVWSRGTGAGPRHATAAIPWSDKVMSPTALFVRRRDKRVVLGLDKPGPELKGSGRGGDWERVVLVRFTKEGPREVEVRWRDEVLEEERKAEAEEEQQGSKGKL